MTKPFPSPKWKEEPWKHGALRNHADQNPDMPLLPYGRDARRSLLAKAVFTPSGVKQVSFLPMMIDELYRPEVLRRGDPRFDDMVRHGLVVRGVRSPLHRAGRRGDRHRRGQGDGEGSLTVTAHSAVDGLQQRLTDYAAGLTYEALPAAAAHAAKVRVIDTLAALAGGYRDIFNK